MREALIPLSPDNRRHPPLPTAGPGGREALSLLAHHPALTRAFVTFNGYVLWDTTLTPRLRQLLILRVAARRHSSFVWTEHSYNALHSGLTEEEIAAASDGPDSPCWNRMESALLCAVDELVDDGIISDPTWKTLSAALDVQQLMDVVFTVGCYETTSWFFRSFGLEARP
jgi:alkylhydroperoxidase family enzyme